MNNGWIKLHRRIIDNPIAKKPHYAWLWIVLLLKANHKEKEFIWNNKKKICKRGQVLTGRKKLSLETGISEGTVENILKYLESEQQIEQQKTTKFRLITVKNYKKFQTVEQQIEQQADNKLTTKLQQNDTNKNDKNVKNDKNTVLQADACDNINPLMVLFKDINPTINFGNKTQRNALKDLIKKFGYEKTENTIKYAVSVQGSQYAPTITTPYQLKNKIGDLMVFYKKENNNKPLII